MVEQRRALSVPFYSMDELARLARIGDAPAGGAASEEADATEVPRPTIPVASTRNRALEAMYADRVRRARVTLPIEKLRESLASYQSVAARMNAGIRIRKPDADDAECLRVVRAQLTMLRQLQERPVYMLVAGDGR